VLGAKDLCGDAHRVAHHVPRLARPATLAQQVGQVAHGIERLRVTRPKHLAPPLHCLAHQRLRFRGPGARLQQQPQLVDPNQRLGVAGAEQLLLARQRLPEEGFRLL
jgi:hypothetical protein